MNAEPLLIVNADDFGMTAGISAGILAAHRGGIVTSTSVLANGRVLAEFVGQLLDSPRLGVGVHLAAVGEDPPLLSAAEIPTLVDRHGQFPTTWRAFLMSATAGRIDPNDLAREFRAQLELVQALRIPITHLDAHQHLQLWPLVRDVMLELATAAGIGAVRAPRYRSATPVGLGVSALGRSLTRAADQRGIVYTADSVGIEIAGHLDLPTLARVFTELNARRPTSFELTVHPGLAEDPHRDRYRWGYEWNQELTTLTSPAAAAMVAGSGFRLGTYADLTARKAAATNGGRAVPPPLPNPRFPDPDPTPDPRGPMALSVVVPAFNEADLLHSAVTGLANGLRTWNESFEIVIVENGSTDATPRIAEQLAAEIHEVRMLSLPSADYGRALKVGILMASARTVALLDVDLCDLSFVKNAMSVLDRAPRPTGPVIVVGSKRAPGANDQRPPMRRAATALFTSILRRGFALSLSDTHGVKVLRADVLRPAIVECTLGADLFDTELILRAERAGFNVAELPISVHELRPPRSPVLQRVPRTLAGLFKLRRALRSAPPATTPGPAAREPTQPEGARHHRLRPHRMATEPLPGPRA